MATGEDNIISSGFDYKTVEINEESLYTGMIPGIASTAQSYDIPIPFDIENTSGAYWEPAAEIKWLRNRNNVTMQENKELRLELKVYKKIIKNLLKKKS
jgi:hypothetical protein